MRICIFISGRKGLSMQIDLILYLVKATTTDLFWVMSCTAGVTFVAFHPQGNLPHMNDRILSGTSIR